MENSQGLLLLPKAKRQGGGHACLLFNLALERAIRDSRVETTVTIFYKSIQILVYADDIDIIGLRLSYVTKAYQGIEQAAENLRLQINEAKAEHLGRKSLGRKILGRKTLDRKILNRKNFGNKLLACCIVELYSINKEIKKK